MLCMQTKMIHKYTTVPYIFFAPSGIQSTEVEHGLCLNFAVRSTSKPPRLDTSDKFFDLPIILKKTTNDITAGNGREGLRIVTKRIVINGLFF